ncbi:MULTISPECIES: ABC transporter ATP-binding protein [unclassified Brevibacterium]|uniref:ABC transporter ATP-binding protein n=1 Tax=unclassified Brevibacterium TaxID=2614124 RepID=UPI00107FE0A1|nr:ABC transporter ATP-binding protein [Brevibacterium sp. S111]TGD09690.1 ABC transporter ATP-binding protein [Brevibacterium sp. S111]
MKLELRGMTKVFGSFVANDHIDLTIEPGEIHALLGENGAGKSTMMNVLYGLYDADGGDILIDDEPVKFSGPGDAVAAGIGMVHQHFMLVPVFTVAESVALGYEPTKSLGLLDIAEARKKVTEISSRFNFNIDPDALIEDLPVGAQQRVEIIKALSRDAEILILDEPTAVLTPQETDELISIMRQLKEQGTSIVFITHKLREVRAIADSITVIRRGKIVGEASPDSTETELASQMVGRAVSLTTEKDDADPGDATFQVRNLTVVDKAENVVVDDVSFDVRRGEILAVAGVQGNGQTELAETIIGLTEPRLGTITLDGKSLGGASVKDRLGAGIGFVPEDRSTDGIIAEFAIRDNMILDVYDREPYAKGLNLRSKTITAEAKKKVEEFDIRLGSVVDPISTLSGGNQQKVVLSRELGRELRLFIASQPTRGLDVGSIEFVHKRVIAERDSGTPCIIVSTELDEVYGLADRIAVMYSGRIVGVVGADTSREALGLMMAGVPADEALAATTGTSDGSDHAQAATDEAGTAATAAGTADDDSATTSAEETK